LFNNALVNIFTLSNDEIRVDTYPYFFSASKRDHLSYKWVINGRSTDGTDGPAGLTLRRENESGEASISVRVQNFLDVLQHAGSSFRIAF